MDSQSLDTASLVIREMQIKATSIGVLLHTHRCGCNIKSDNENVSKDEEKLEPSYTAKRNIKWYCQFGNSLASQFNGSFYFNHKNNLTLENVGDLNRLRTKDILIESL